MPDRSNPLLLPLKATKLWKTQLNPFPPHMPVPSAPVHPDFDHIPNLQARLVRLETIIPELQLKLERVAQHEMALESLRRRYEQITALL